MSQQFTPMRDADVEATLGLGKDHQMVTFSLRREQHEELLEWSKRHDFSMVAVIRGIVERFLEEQRADPALTESAG